MKINEETKSAFGTIFVGEIFRFRGDLFMKTLDFKEVGYDFPMNAITLDGCSFSHFEAEDLVQLYPNASLNLT